MTHSKDDAITAAIRAAALGKIEEGRIRARAKIKAGTTDFEHTFEDGHTAPITSITAEARIAMGVLEHLDKVYADVEQLELMD